MSGMSRVDGGFWKWTTALAVLVMAWVSLTGCDQPPNESSLQPPESDLRIVSLSPALTQILMDLGQGEFIVGVGQNDMSAPVHAKVVGTYLDVNAEAIVQLKPTLVLTMSGRDGPPARLKELAADHFLLVNYAYPRTPAEVGDIIFRDSEMHMALAMATSGVPVTPGTVKPAPGAPTPAATAATPPQTEKEPSSIGALLDLIPQAMKLKYTMIMRLGEISKITKDQGSPSVLMVIGTGPVMASGPGSVLDQLLALCGGRNVATDAKISAPTFDREKLLALKPDVVLYFSPQGKPLADLEHEPRLAEFRGLDIPAVRDNRIVLIDDAQSMLPSSSLDKTAGMMAKALHPELAAAIDQVLKASMVDLSRKNDIDALPAHTTQPALLPGSVNEPAPATTQPTTQPAASGENTL